jgi:dTDP-4-amino-4,6-dideoxygalactose transaminase
MTSTTKVPFLDLVTPHQELKAELMAVVEKAFDSAGFIGGPMVEDFERGFAAFSNAKYCVGVNSGTDALRFAFMAADVKPGEIVRFHVIATTEAISHRRYFAFVDINEKTYTMDLEAECLADTLQFQNRGN